MKRSVLLIYSAAIAIFLCSCFGYRVGTLLPKDLKSIHVPTFKNTTNEPNLEARATNVVVDRLNLDGTLKVLPNRDNSDTLLEATIVKYERRPIRFAAGRTPSEYRLTITVKATFTNLRTAAPIWKDKLISGQADFPVRGSLPSSETAALPAVFEDLAHDIVEAIVEGWE